MLTKEENEMLTRVGKGTPMGEFFRKYWLPVGISADLKTKPTFIRVLGEDLVLYRDKSGTVGAARRPLRAPAGEPLPRYNDEQGPDVPLPRLGLRCRRHGAADAE